MTPTFFQERVMRYCSSVLLVLLYYFLQIGEPSIRAETVLVEGIFGSGYGKLRNEESSVVGIPINLGAKINVELKDKKNFMLYGSFESLKSFVVQNENRDSAQNYYNYTINSLGFGIKYFTKGYNSTYIDFGGRYTFWSYLNSNATYYQVFERSGQYYSTNNQYNFIGLGTSFAVGRFWWWQKENFNLGVGVSGFLQLDLYQGVIYSSITQAGRTEALLKNKGNSIFAGINLNVGLLF